MTVLLITHDPEVAATLPRTITIRDGRIASEGRSGEEYAVVATDGSLPLPPHVAELLPAGTLVQVTTEDGEIRLTPVEQEGPHDQRQRSDRRVRRPDRGGRCVVRGAAGFVLAVSGPSGAGRVRCCGQSPARCGAVGPGRGRRAGDHRTGRRPPRTASY